MDDVPCRTLLVVTSFSRIVVPEAIEEPIPERRKPRNKQRLAERDPNIINHEIAAHEVFQFEVVRLSDRFGVFRQTSE